MKETNPSGIATRNSASSGVQLTCLPVEILDMILSHNLSSLADFQAARQTSRVFRRVVMQSKEFKRRLGKAHIILDSDMTKKAVKLWQSSVWRETTHTVVLGIPRARPYHAAARPHWHDPLRDASHTAITNPDLLRCILEFILSLPNLHLCTVIHNVPANATQIRSRTQRQRNQFKKEFMNVLDAVMLANTEFGLVGHLIVTGGKLETGEVDDHFGFSR